MARSGRGPGISPAAITAPGSRRAPRRPGVPDRGSKVLMGLLALGLARHLLRSRRFQEGVAVTAIAVEALRGIARENRAGMMARLSAWNKRQVERLERETERQARAVKGAGRRVQSEARTLAAGGDAIAGEGRSP
jgi:hypothetical protein